MTEPTQTPSDAPALAGTAATELALPDSASDLGHRFRWLHTGTAFYGTLTALIDAARSTVDVEFYTIAPGEPATRLGDALARAAARGVRVRLLADAFGSSALPGDWAERLRALGADVRWFNPRPLLRWSFRDHRKLVVCDGATALVGGFNVAPEFEGDGVSRGWRDLGLAIEGPAAGDLAMGFEALFDASQLERRQVRPLARFLRGQRARADAVAAIVGGPAGPQALLKRTMRADLQAAVRVDLAAAYFLPSRRLRRLLRQVAQRGKVRVLLPAHSDVPVARLASQHLYAGLLRGGIAIHEYQPQVMHTKALVIDDVVYVGSANLDVRSLQLNFELVVRLPSVLLAAQLRSRIEHDLALSVAVPADWPRRRPLLARLLQSWSHFLLARVDPYVARSQFRHLR